MLIANDGQVALEVVEEDDAGKGKQDAAKKKGSILKNSTEPFDLNEADFRSRDIQILTCDDEEDEEEKALQEYRLKMVALLPEAGQNFTAVYENQNELDAGFDAFMDEEYDDYKIGELDEDEIQAENKIDKKVLDQACNEFIEDKKRWFMDLAKEFGDEKANKLIPDIKSSDLIHEEDLKNGEMPEEIKQKIRERLLANADVFEQEAEETVNDDVYRDEKSDEDAWDAETILTTYTNTDNHPGLIKTERRVRPSQRMKIELHKQFKVPVDGLIPLAEEITIQKEKKASMDNKPFSRVPASQGERPPASPR